MRRLSFFEDEPWNEVDDEGRPRVRWFGHPFGADMLGASLIELLPGAPGGPLHMHYGVEEMFFVLAGAPTIRTPRARRPSRPETSSTSRRAVPGCTTSRIPRMNRPGYSASRRSGFPTSSRIPSAESAGSPRAIPSDRSEATPTTESSLGSNYRRTSTRLAR